MPITQKRNIRSQDLSNPDFRIEKEREIVEKERKKKRKKSKKNSQGNDRKKFDRKTMTGDY